MTLSEMLEDMKVHEKEHVIDMIQNKGDCSVVRQCDLCILYGNSCSDTYMNYPKRYTLCVEWFLRNYGKEELFEVIL